MSRITAFHRGSLVARTVPTVDARMFAPHSVSDSELERRVSRAVNSRLRSRDEVLNAVSSGKVLALGTVWTGELKPHIDARLEAIKPLVTGLSLGRVLHAEPGSHSLRMGRKWTGDILGLIRAGARDSEGQEGEQVDLTDLTRSASKLEDAFEKGNPDLILSNAKKLEEDFAMVRERHSDAAQRTADAAFAERGAREAAATRDTIRALNEANREFWSGRDINGTAVPTRHTQVPQPTRTRDWAHEMPGGSPFVNAAHLKHSAPRGAPSIAEINRRNARFWRERNGDDLPPAAA